MSITPGSSYTNPVQTDLTCINQSMAKTKHQMAKIELISICMNQLDRWESGKKKELWTLLALTS